MSLESKPYRYFDTPDGEDVFKKLWIVLKPSAVLAVAASTTDVLLYSKPKGFINILFRFSSISFPILTVSTAFVLSTNLVASIRKTNDNTNWFLGGFTAGTTFGFLTRRPMIGFNMGLLLGVAALVKKNSQLSGYTLTPPSVKTSRGSLWLLHHDLSLLAERPRNWTTGQEDAK
ncbi:uncharacterized protein LOC132708365 [Cylas formicarius]|uniref:uncharacterized protein LOC132708365 n=1 Tax=Cylas formicarius TaxID=197179 RepID=UPI00295834CF|nr:uncharacterized protein LOC132708365 [Cylas formicarius]